MVSTSSGSFFCPARKTCTMDVVDFFFDETFVPVPLDGYEFMSWKKADRHFCGNDQKPCRLVTAGLDGNGDLAALMLQFFASDEVFYLSPVYQRKSEISPE